MGARLFRRSSSDESKKKINALLSEIRQLPDLEKLLLYLQLPTGGTATDPFRQNCNNPLGSRLEVTQTVTWIRTHLREDSEVSLPKHEVYEDYCHYCQMHSIKPLSTADFGKVMKHVFPSVRPRRLGTRGNSKYCYSGLRKKLTLEPPKLPNLSADRDSTRDEDDALSQDGVKACSYVILEWAHKLLENKFETLKELACHLVETKLVDARSFGAFTVLSLGNSGKTNPASVLLNQGGSKHRDAQLQLQRKIHEKGLIKEQKKRLNDIRGERSDAKERRRASSGPCARSMRSLSTSAVQVCSMPTTPLPSNDSPPSKPATPVDVKGVVGKSEKKESCMKNGSATEALRRVGKVQIPRINRQSPKVCIAPSIILLPQLAPLDVAQSCGKPKPKFKPIQPKPSEPKTENGESVASNKRKSVETGQATALKRGRSDEEETENLPENVSDNSKSVDFVRFVVEETQSRDVLLSQTTKLSDRELSEMLADDARTDDKVPETENPLMMDFMEGSSASMEQDEELSHYFSETTTTAPSTPTKRTGDVGQSAQLTQLRWLLEHNLKPSPPASNGPNNSSNSNNNSNWNVQTTHTLRQLLTQPTAKLEKSDCAVSVAPQAPAAAPGAIALDSLETQPLPSMEMLTGFSLTQHHHQPTQPDSVKRRVSFPFGLNESANLDASSVPPSPNTRCRSFNFTPISPRHTPLPEMKGLLMMSSQPASACASPFVSPSGTPVPLARSRHNSGQAVSYGTTPRTTPYPSEHSSTVNSPFISPHPTPVPFCKSRSNSSQQQQRLAMANLNNRSRPASTLVSPRSAPMSPMNYSLDPEMNNNNHKFGFAENRSRNNSNSSVPPMSPCSSAPMSPHGMFQQNGMFSCLGNQPVQPVIPEVQEQNFGEWGQGYQNQGGGYHQNAMSSNDPRALARQRYEEMLMLQRSNSVPVSQVAAQCGGNYSYPATPTAGSFTDLIDDGGAGDKGLGEVSYDLGTTLEDLRACDDAYSQFAQEFEQSPPKGLLMPDDDVFPSKNY